MHVTTLAPTQPVFASKNFCGHALEVNTLGYRDMVRAVGGRHCISGPQVTAHSHGNRFLPGGQMHFSRDGSRSNRKQWGFAL